MRRRGGITIGLGVAVAAVALTGCVGFKGPIRGKQVSEHRVQVKFKACSKPDTGGPCEALAPRRGDSQPHMLVGFRVRKGTRPPRRFKATNSDTILRRSDSYTAELRAAAPATASQRWFGYLSSALSKADISPATYPARFAVRFRLPRHPGNAFRYRPVLGGVVLDPGAEVSCGTDLYSDTGSNAICIDDPQSEDATRESLKVKLD